MVEQSKVKNVKQLYSLDDKGKLTLHFHPAQTRAWESEQYIVVLCGGRQSGKTSTSPWWLNREIRRTARSGQSNSYLAVSASNDLFAMAFLPAMIEVFVDVLGIGHYWTARRTLEIKCLDPDSPHYGKFYQGPRGSSSGSMWARVVLRSAQSEGALESVTALAAVLDEAGQSAFTNQDWEAIQGRVAIARSRGAGRILITTTPYSMDSFLYEQVYIPWLEHGDASGVDFIQFPSYYNPNWTLEEFRRQEATMPDWRAAMFLHGKFKRPAGLIYRDFDEGAMLVREQDEFVPPLHWERVVGIDFGGANTATLWLALNPDDGRWYAYHESLMGHMPTSEHAAIAEAEAIGIDRLTAVGGAKSEGQHRDDWWQAGFYIEEPPVYDVEAGIARVISLIKKDRFRAFASLGRLRKELRNYSRKLDQNNEPTEQIINKNKFHACLVGGTAVTTDKGDVPLKDIVPGDKVLTRGGYRSVLASSMTHKSADAVTVSFSNGVKITGTPDHKIFTRNRGYIALHALRYDDIIVTSDYYTKKEMLPCHRNTESEKQLNGAVGHTADTQMPVLGLIECIIRRILRSMEGLLGHSIYTEIFGKRRMAKFQMALLFIIEMATRSITKLKTWKRYVKKHTWRTIWRRDFMMVSLSSACVTTLMTSDILPLNGMDHQRVEHGIAGMAKGRGRTESQGRLLASIAGTNMKQNRVMDMRSSVPIIASRKQGEREILMPLVESVHSAEKRSERIDTARESIVPGNVIGTCAVAEKQPVYNIAVDSDPGEYFANGILVRNCDALRYAGAWIEDAPLGAESMSYQEFINSKAQAQELAYA